MHGCDVSTRRMAARARRLAWNARERHMRDTRARHAMVARMTEMPASAAPADWRRHLPPGVRPYAQRAPIGALLLGISSGFPFAMIGATLTTRLAEADIEKKAVTAFALAFLMYNFKFLWAPAIDRVRIPVLANAIGQRRAWLVVVAAAVMAAVA